MSSRPTTVRYSDDYVESIIWQGDMYLFTEVNITTLIDQARQLGNIFERSWGPVSET